MSERRAKYMWSDVTYTKWCKEQAQRIKKKGIKVDTTAVTRMIYDSILIPNNIDLSKLIVTKKFKLKRVKR